MFCGKASFGCYSKLLILRLLSPEQNGSLLHSIFFIRTCNIEIQAGCSEFFPTFKAELFLICS